MGINFPDSDGGGSTGRIPPSGSGGTTGGGGGASSSSAVNLANLPATGGLVGFQMNLLCPVFDFVKAANVIYFLDSDNFDTEEDVIVDFKVEEFEPGNKASIHRVLLRYRDLGQVTFTLAVVSADNSVIDYTKCTGNAQLITIGNNGANNTPTGKIHTFKASLIITTEAPQVKIIRNRNSGPLAITKVKTWASYGDGDII